MTTQLARITDFAPLVALVTDTLNSEHSKRAYARAIAGFAAWYAGQGSPGFSKKLINAYRAHLLDQGASPATVNQALAALKALAREGADNGYLSPATAAAVGRVKGVKSEQLPAGRALSDGEIVALFRACAADPTAAGARDAAVLALLRLGLRRAEIAALELGNLDLGAGKVRVLGKGRRERAVDLLNGAAAALEDWVTVRGSRPGPLLLAVRKGGHVDRTAGISGAAIAQILARRAEQAGVTACTPHDLRRTFVGDMLTGGTDLSIVADLAGHSDLNTTRRYDRRPAEARRLALGRLHVPYVRRL
jgi:site-specific recombinase XerD